MYVQDTLRYYCFVVRRHLLLILAGTLVAGVLTMSISLSLPPVYQARALVRVNGSTATSSTAANNDVFSTQALAVSYALLVTDPDVLVRAARQLPGMSAEQLKQAVSDSPLDSTQLIEIRAQDRNPKRAATIANAVADAFIELQIAKESARLQDAMKKNLQTLTQVKLQIHNAQQQIALLQKSQGTPAEIADQQSLLDGHQSNYTSLLSNYNQLQLQQLQAHTMLSVAQSATAPAEPLGPHPWLNMLLASFVGLLLMLVLVLLLDWFDATIQTEQDVIRLAALTPLACIPHTSHGDRLLDLTQEENNAARNAYSLLGTAFLGVAQDARTILITALQMGVGKSTTALYLAVTLAQAGKRVLLIDANIHRPILHTVFKQSNQTGITTALQDMYTCRQHPETLPEVWLNQWKTHVPNLWLLPAGPEQAHTITTLRQPALHLLEKLMMGKALNAEGDTIPDLVDFVIIDSPPLEHPDTQSLTAITEATVLVVEAGKERRDTLQHAQDLLQRLGTPVLGLVVNQQRPRHRSYFYVSQGAGVVAKTVPDSAKKSLEQQQPALLPPPQKILVEERTGSGKTTLLFPRLLQTSVPVRLASAVALENGVPETPSPLPVAHAIQALSAAKQSFPDTDIQQPRLQFAPRLRLSGISGPVKPMDIDGTTQG